nr:MAG TPA: hypothetical protein [Caudoviricetes sp.]
MVRYKTVSKVYYLLTIMSRNIIGCKSRKNLDKRIKDRTKRYELYQKYI